MPEYLAPGVYVEEVSFRSKSIEGVPTSTTGWAGAPQQLSTQSSFVAVAVAAAVALVVGAEGVAVTLPPDDVYETHANTEL